MSDYRSSTLKEPIDVGEYLFRRLRQVGVSSVHGVPGDYNLVALDYIPKCGLSWVGNCNELNAGYAADGYARIKGISALVTTFGVGELSALNAIAGAYSEYVPLVHIVGTPSTLSQANGMLLHHTLGNGDFNVFTNMSANISCAVSRLTDPMNAAGLIDHAIRECYVQSRPVYITLPTDLVQKKVDGARLADPIDLSFPANDPEQEDFVVDHVLSLLKAAKKPVILVDACAIRHRALEETLELIKKSRLPTFVAPMGKGAVNEQLPNYYGVYAGDGSHADVERIVDSSDLVLSIGSIKSDFNTAGFTYHTSQLNLVEFHSSYIKVKYSEYRGVRMNGVLKKVSEKLNNLDLSQMAKKPATIVASGDEEDNSATITHKWFWPQLQKWMKQKDIVITETGTSGYGIWEVQFQADSMGISQVLWGSIGYATGSCQGAALAAKELDDESKDVQKRRTILFTGDGSFQLTAQELSTMLRRGLNPIIFVICNEGYTIERFIHGMDATYNDIAPWKYKDLPAAFGAEPGGYRTYTVKTKEDVVKLLQDDEFGSPSNDALRFVELHMPKEDAPIALKMTAEASAKNNAKQ